MASQLTEDARSETIKRQIRREAKRLSLSKRWRPTYLQAVLLVGAMLALLLFGLRIYWSKPIKRPQINLNAANSMRLLTNLQFSLEQYATAHGDRYPDNLYDLLPDFLANTEQNRYVLRMLDYRLSQPEDYVLRIKENAPFSGKKLVATAEEIRLAEVE